MKILVTGAGGFIGSHVLKRLMTLRVDSVGVDNFSNYYSSKYKHIRLKEIGIQKDIQVLNCNLAVFDEIDNLVSKYKPNYIIHLAAQAGVRLSLSQTNLYIDTNVCGFQNLIRSAIENHVDGIIYASYSSVYGDSSSIPYKEDMQILRPKSIYGVTKLSNELFAEIQSKDSKLRFRGLRFFTVYGPWGRPDMAYFKLAAAALGQGRFNLFGDGSIKRDFTYIDDVVESTISLCTDLASRKEGFSDLVNIGGGRPLEMNYLIELISDRGDFEIDILKSPESPLDSRITVADNSYLQSIIGAKSFTNLEEGVARLMDWAKREEIKSSLLSWISSVG